MRKKPIFQLTYHVFDRLIKITISAVQKKLTNLAASKYNLYLTNNSKNTLSKNTTKNALFVKKNRFHNLKINRSAMNYELTFSEGGKYHAK